MLKLEKFTLGALETNAYLITDQTGETGVVIDPGANPKSLLKRIQNIRIEAILLTHAHFDHIAGLDEVRKLKNCPVYLHAMEADWLSDSKLNGSARWPDATPPIVTDPAEYDLADGQKLKLLGQEWKVIHIPGHSPGSVGFLFDDVLIGGDVLFRLSVGRSDLPGGDTNMLEQSIKRKVYTLPESTVVHPGHGPKTTVGYEKANNPYLR